MTKVPDDGAAGNESAPLDTRSPAENDNKTASQRKNIAVPAEFFNNLLVTVGVCGLPKPSTRAFQVWLDDIHKRPNLPPKDNDTPGGHMDGEYLFDDPDGTRARAALSFASRRWAERAALTGQPSAVAVDRILQLILSAMDPSVPDQPKRLAAVCRLGDMAAEHLRTWTEPQRTALLGDIARDASNRLSEAGDNCSPDELGGPVHAAMDGAMFYLRSRFIIREEFWEAPDLARLVVGRAREHLRHWSSGLPYVFPNCEARTDNEDASADRCHLPMILVGALSRGEPQLTHRGASCAARAAHANRVAAAIGRELNERREEFREVLCNAANSDRVNHTPPGHPKSLFDRDRPWVAYWIAHCAFKGLYVANGQEAKRAGRDAYNRLSNVLKNLPKRP